jgi:hypothetical protein
MKIGVTYIQVVEESYFKMEENMKLITLKIILLVLLSVNLEAQKNYPSGTIENPERGVTFRESSYDLNIDANNDYQGFEPGETKVLADLNGPGRITHLWFTIGSNERAFPRSIVIRVFWDGNDDPAVEAPLGDFFAAGHGMQVNVNSAMVATSSFGRAYNCYWPMPFRKSAKVTITNESKDYSMGMYWYVDWEKREVPVDVPYFHAQYRQEYPIKPGHDYLIADIEGKGHYVGTVLSVYASQPGWFGEGDDRFYIDGDTKPTIHGTGTEDYFNDAWAFRVVNRPYYGVSIWEGMKTGSRITAYRWHLTDPIFFDKSLRFEIEHKGNTFYDDESLLDLYTDGRMDMYSSVAFWYQQGKAKRYTEMAPVEKRIVTYSLLQIEEMDITKMQGIELFEDGTFTNGKGLKFNGTEAHSFLEIPFEVDEDSRYVVYLRITPNMYSGVFDIYVDGQKHVKDIDLYREHSFATDIKIGAAHKLKKGKHTIKVVCKGNGKNGSDSWMLIDAVILEKISAFKSKLINEEKK